MKGNFRFAMLCLLLAVSIGAFYEESKLTLSPAGHTLSQIFILLVVFWLTWRWVKYDEACYLREYHASRHALKNHRIVSTGEYRVDLNDETNAHQLARTTRETSPQQHDHRPAGDMVK